MSLYRLILTRVGARERIKPNGGDRICYRTHGRRREPKCILAQCCRKCREAA